ncbi:MAG: hypothetical protein JW808_03610, partial [Victivallales bacterium]|nr:hypothetical protein [Victivallales bacterium]
INFCQLIKIYQLTMLINYMKLHFALECSADASYAYAGNPRGASVLYFGEGLEFRHSRRVNTLWVDGHVGNATMNDGTFPYPFTHGNCCYKRPWMEDNWIW